jgi:hypothetical protein
MAHSTTCLPPNYYSPNSMDPYTDRVGEVFVRDYLELQELDVKLVQVATDEDFIRQILQAITPTKSKIYSSVIGA